MAKAGFCSECGANVWVNEDGSCANGHAPYAVSGVYATGEPAPIPAPGPIAPKKSGAGVIIAVVLAVVVLIGCGVAGLVAAISLPLFSAASSSAQQKECFANQRMIEGAVQQYLAADPGNEWRSGTIPSGSVLITDGYLKELPLCPIGGEYYYDADTQSTTCPKGDPPDGHGHY